MFRKNKQSYNKLRSRTSIYFLKNFIIFLFFFSIFTGIVVFIIYKNTREQELVSEKSRYLRVSEKIASQLDFTLKEMSDLGVFISMATMINNQNVDSNLTYNTSSQFDYLMPYGVPVGREHQRVSVINENGSFRSFGYPISLKRVNKEFESGKYDEIYEKMKDLNLMFVPPHKDYWGNNKSTYFITCVRRLIDGVDQDTIGFVLVELPSQNFVEILQSSFKEKIFLLDKDLYSIPMYECETSISYNEICKKSPNLNSGPHLWYDLNKNGTKCMYIYRGLDYANWSLLLEVEESNLLQSTYSSLSSMMIILMFTYIGLMILVFLSMRYASKPLVNLRKQIDKINLNRPELELETPFIRDEVELLNDALKRMIERLNKAADEKALMHSRELNASFIALQAQINPHFLFNLFQVFSVMAKEHQNQELFKALQALSEMLRYITCSSPKIVPLVTEINHVKNYLTLMKLSKGEQLTYDIIFDETSDIADLKVPRMSIQPLIENAFKHGFTKVFPPWKLLINIYSNNNSWQIQVFNNGIGMSKAEILELENEINYFLENPMEFLEDSAIGGMGLISSISRFKSLYGGNFSYEIISPDKTAGFLIVLKVRKDDNFESSNS